MGKRGMSPRFAFLNALQRKGLGLAENNRNPKITMACTSGFVFLTTRGTWTMTVSLCGDGSEQGRSSV